MGLVEIVLAGLCLTSVCPDDNEDTYLLKHQRSHFVKLKEELRNENLRITTLPNGILSGYKSHGNGTLEGTGVAFDIIQILKRKYGFNYTVVAPEDPVFTNHGSNVKSIMNLLNENIVDIAAAFLPVLYTEQVRYSRNLDTAEWVVLMKRPTESATGSGLLAPFTAAVWSLIIISLVVVGPIMYLLILLQARLCRKDKNPVYTLPACMWFVYGALLKQGSTLNPTTDSSRLLFSTWWIFITVLTAFYTANLTAFLTLSKFTLPITKPSDIKDKHYSWVTNRGNGITDYVEIHSDATYKAIGVPLKTNYSDENILQAFVDKQNMMYIRERTVLEYIMYDDYKKKTKAGIEENLRCTFVITEWPIVVLPRAFAFSKNFKYHELFDSTIEYLIESGIVEFKQREKLPDTKICPLNLGNKERRLRNSDLIMTYMIVGGGLVISTVVFAVELIIQFWKRKKKIGVRIETQNLNNISLFYTKKSKPPPPYNSLFAPHISYMNGMKSSEHKKKVVNGTEYWVMKGNTHGTVELIPYRTPSALLYQFTR